MEPVSPYVPRPGDLVETPRGVGVARSPIQGLPGSESVLVQMAEGVQVDFAPHDVWPYGGVEANLEAVAGFLADDDTRALAAVKAFLEDPDAEARAPLPALGLTRGAMTHWCDCACGRAGGCMRRSTALHLHQPELGSCRCETKECPCA